MYEFVTDSTSRSLFLLKDLENLFPSISFNLSIIISDRTKICQGIQTMKNQFWKDKIQPELHYNAQQNKH